MRGLFTGASSFNQNLCAWRDNFPYDQAIEIFSDSGCAYQDKPTEAQKGPFCASNCQLSLPTETAVVVNFTHVQERTDENWIVVNGYVYDVTNLLEQHPTGPAGVEAFLHEDASRLFPRTPPALLPDICINKEKFGDNTKLQETKSSCVDFNDDDIKNGLPCHKRYKCNCKIHG